MSLDAERARIIAAAEKAGDLVTRDDGFAVYWPAGLHGALSEWALRALADELATRNAGWQAEMEHALSVNAAPYISPIPAMISPNYHNRIEGQPAMERLHMWPKRDGGIMPCDPRGCRECERERTWKEGQTHGV